MDFQFKVIDDNTIQEASALRVDTSQKHFVESVEQSYLEAKQFCFWRPVAIVLENVMIGFAMYGLYEEAGKVPQLWLDRFFIDYRFQQKGYAKKAMLALLEVMKYEYGEQTIYLSVYEQNGVAIHLYEKLGFKFNGEMDINGELVMVLHLT